MRLPRLLSLVLVTAAAAVTAGCVAHPVGPARTFDKYEGKAVTTAQSALSAVSTVQLGADTGSNGKAFGPYLAVLTSEQEDALSGVQGTFNSIQPPNDNADQLRRELNAILSSSLDHVSAVRVAVHRGQLDTLNATAAPLAADATALRAFIAQHGAP
jgi:hypothetical protein